MPANSSTATSPPMKKTKKPTRPLSAYNIFYQHERARVLLLSEHGERIEDHPCPPDLTAEDVRSVLESNPYRIDRAKRPHRKTHGKVSFADLQKIVTSGWRNLGAKTRKAFDELADKDKERHREEMAAYREWQARESRAALGLHVAHSDDHDGRKLLSNFKNNNKNDSIEAQKEKRPAADVRLDVKRVPATNVSLTRATMKKKKGAQCRSAILRQGIITKESRPLLAGSRPPPKKSMSSSIFHSMSFFATSRNCARSAPVLIPSFEMIQQQGCCPLPAWSSSEGSALPGITPQAIHKKEESQRQSQRSQNLLLSALRLLDEEQLEPVMSRRSPAQVPSSFFSDGVVQRQQQDQQLDNGEIIRFLEGLDWQRM